MDTMKTYSSIQEIGFKVQLEVWVEGHITLESKGLGWMFEGGGGYSGIVREIDWLLFLEVVPLKCT